MNRRLVTILLLAFLIATGCAFLVWRMVGSRIDASKPKAGTRVVAAAADIKLGAILTASNLGVVEISGTPPKGAILEKDKGSVVGRGVISNLYEGEPILDSRLAAIGSGGGLAATIPTGMRACAIKVDDVVGVAGFVTPGMRVDVLVSGTPPGTNSSPESTQAHTILQNIEVLSAGTDIQKDSEGKPKQVQVVNLLVSPGQAETLSLAANQQVKIQLVLRNPLDTQVAEVPGTAMATLFGSPKPPPPVHRPVGVKVVRVAAPHAISVDIINGSKHSQEKFATSEEKQ
jgi:pilus assembly protein CpaB